MCALKTHCTTYVLVLYSTVCSVPKTYSPSPSSARSLAWLVLSVKSSLVSLALTIPWQRWHLMSGVRLVGMDDEEGFTAPAPYKTKDLLGFVARGAIVEGVDNMEGGCEDEDVKERAPEEATVWDWIVDAE
jgi:hypothetical protein